MDYYEDNHRGLKRILIIVGVLLLVIVIGFFLYFMFFAKDKSTGDEANIIVDASENVKKGTIIEMNYYEDQSIKKDDGSYGVVYYITIEGDDDDNSQTEMLRRKISVPEDVYFALNIGDTFDTSIPPEDNIVSRPTEKPTSKPVQEQTAEPTSEPQETAPEGEIAENGEGTEGSTEEPQSTVDAALTEQAEDNGLADTENTAAPEQEAQDANVEANGETNVKEEGAPGINDGTSIVG